MHLSSFCIFPPKDLLFFRNIHLFSLGALFTPLKWIVYFCMFCTEGHVSMCHFTQFYKVTKEIIEIYKDFMYNGTIRVS